jgi:hypothetical protein
MGSLLSPVITNFFMAEYEVRALAQATHKLLCWFHYVDDTLPFGCMGQAGEVS